MNCARIRNSLATTDRGRSRTRMQGFTLVELMVAVTIGLIILVAVAQIFTTSRATYQVEEGLARVQENGRIAMEFLARDLRMAGYAGCFNVNKTMDTTFGYTAVSRLQTTTFATDFATAPPLEPLHIRGHNYTSPGTWTPALPGIFGAVTPIDGTDVLAIRRGDTQSFPLETAMGTTGANVDLGANLGTALAVGNVVMVTDCQGFDIFQITNIDANQALAHGGPGPNLDGNLSRNYTANAEVMKLLTRVYFIGRRAGLATNPPSLFMLDMNEALTLELVENVENMQILYGEDVDGDQSADIYRTADAIVPWSRVVSVRVALLLRTPTETGTDVDTNVYDMFGDTGSATDDFDPANDRRQRRIFNSTIQLRNQRTS